MSDTPTEPAPVTLEPKDLNAIHVFRASVWTAAQRLREGDPLRAALVEALFLFQLNARQELRP